ncbi:Rtr1/RPAP2 family-domain-containing protein [Xylaria nigripes]|nr:Rtr1/RPAP2 family-domain-containing protein [Xylaria nigripes]
MPTTQTNVPKGILKNKDASPATAEKSSSDPREIAIKHARIIHSRRGVENQIADSMIELSKFPVTRNSAHNAANPDPADAESFRSHIRLYQPGDYDDLVEERNANGLCGYTLCPNPRTRLSGAGTFKLVNYGRKDFNIVPSRELEKWCSQKCAKRAMYVKVQLNETAAWERAGISSIQIELFEEDQDSQANPAEQSTKNIENMKIEAQERSAQNARDLALERGDNTQTRKPPNRSIKLAIREKPVQPPVAPSLSSDSQSHLVTEGYKSTFRPGAERAKREENNTEGDAASKNEAPTAL